MRNYEIENGQCRCPHCKQIKSVEEFNQYYCKLCDKEFYLKNKEKWKEYHERDILCPCCNQIKKGKMFSPFRKNCQKCVSFKYTSSPKGKKKKKEYDKNPKNIKRSLERDFISRRTQWVRHQLGAIKSKCKKENIPFNLNEDDFPEMPDICPVLRIKLVIGGKRGYNCPSIDRLNDIGYVSGNCKIISARANLLKNDGTISELEAVLKYMKENGCK